MNGWGEVLTKRFCKNDTFIKLLIYIQKYDKFILTSSTQAC
jgi:hypothetical protein